MTSGLVVFSRVILVSLLLFVMGYGLTPLHAAHIVGGEMTYECQGGDQYRITMYANQEWNIIANSEPPPVSAKPKPPPRRGIVLFLAATPLKICSFVPWRGGARRAGVVLSCVVTSTLDSRYVCVPRLSRSTG